MEPASSFATAGPLSRRQSLLGEEAAATLPDLAEPLLPDAAMQLFIERHEHFSASAARQHRTDTKLQPA